jgi:uncharacterized protein (DUF302 family)
MEKLHFSLMPIQVSTRFRKVPFEAVVSKAVERLHSEGFEVISNLNLKDALKLKFSVQFRNFQIMVAYHPLLAYKAVSLESHSALMLPCHIIIQEHENGDVEVNGFNPMECMENNMATDSLEEVSVEVSFHLRHAIDGLQLSDDKLLVPTA